MTDKIKCDSPYQAMGTDTRSRPYSDKVDNMHDTNAINYYLRNVS